MNGPSWHSGYMPLSGAPFAPLMINLISRPGPPRIFLATFPGLNMVFPQLRLPFQATRRRNLGLDLEITRRGFYVAFTCARSG